MARGLAVLVVVVAVLVGLATVPGSPLKTFIDKTLGDIPVLTCHSAKYICSAVFLSQRDPAHVFELDIKNPHFPHSSLVDYYIDFETKQVSVWIGPMKAFLEDAKLGICQATYRPGLGCTLSQFPESNPPEWKTQSFAPKESKSRKLSSVDWPEGDAASSIHPGVQALLENSIKTNNQTVQTRQIVVIHKGKLVGEAYAPGFPADMPLIGWSMSKSITNALVGAMVFKNKLNINDSKVMPEWQSEADDRHKITIDQLLRMSSGIKFEEVYSRLSDATKMLYMVPSTANYFANQKLNTPPDGEWVYSSGSSNLLAKIIQNQFPNFREYYDFAREFFESISMKKTTFEVDPSGTFVGSSWVWATARDFAAFGQLFLQDGVWDGKRILPVGWVKYSTTPTPKSEGQYGAQWWLSGKVEGFPQDAFFARGFHNQGIVVVPSQELVMVRLGLDYQKGYLRWSDHKLYSAVVEQLNKN